MTGAQADRALSLAQAGWEVQHKRFIGRSTVRSLHAGLRFELLGSARDAELPLKGNDPAQRTLLASSVAHVGINNLPKGLSAQSDGWRKSPTQSQRRCCHLPGDRPKDLRTRMRQSRLTALMRAARKLPMGKDCGSRSRPSPF
jgi:uncharacterized protein involved in type VI secretion and phage assembly